MSISLAESKTACTRILQAGQVPMLKSSPGMGKTSMLKEIAKTFNLLYIDCALSSKDPVDLNGFPITDREKASYLPFDMFPIESDPIPKGYKGWLLSLDELSSVPPAVQVAAYRIALDKMVGDKKLHPACAVACAGNLETDNAVVEEMSTALQSRLVHIPIHSDSTEWLKWAVSANIDTRILGYIAWQPHKLNDFNPDHTDHTFACERTWEFVSKMIAKRPTLDSIDLEIIKGTVGAGTGLEFYSYLKAYADLPTIDQVIAAPNATAIPVEPSTCFAMTGLLMPTLRKTTDLKEIQAIVTYTKRLPIDFQVLAFKTVVKDNPTLLNNQDIRAWSFDLSNHLI